MQECRIKNIARLIRLLDLEIEGVSMNKKVAETHHELSHSFKEEVIVPTVALTNVYDFFMFGSATKIVKTADGIICEAEGFEEKHICDLEDDIKRLYNTDAWSFMKKWHKYNFLMTNMMFIKIWLKKI